MTARIKAILGVVPNPARTVADLGEARRAATLKDAPWNPAKRGMVPTYRHDQVSHCPGCGRSQWWVGSATAECAFCALAMPLADVANVMAGKGRG